MVPLEVYLDAERPLAGLVRALGEAGVEAEEVAPHALAHASSLAHPPRAIGVFARAALPRLDASPESSPVGLRLHGVADPGNVGALLRTADALGPAHVALAAGCADPLSPKAVRASMGAVFRVCLIETADSPPAVRVALAGDGTTALWEADLQPPLTFELGAEREGLPAAALREADAVVAIPLRAGADSLNVAAAGALALYELRRRAA
jgi:TrmH family RNA methyltransferase